MYLPTDTGADPGQGEPKSALVLAGTYLKGVLGEFLREHRFRVIRASTSSNAIARLESDPFDLVVLEAQYDAGFDAADFTTRLRRNGTSASRRAWVLVITRTLQVDEVRRLQRAGVSSVMVGPLKLTRFAERLLVMSQDTRAFIETEQYVGPDRRVTAGYFPEGERRRTGPARARPPKPTLPDGGAESRSA
jgi:DNA-binding response OmpR family regulator